MIALILIGGMGTRLRPLTCDIPKPLLPVVNRPFLLYQFDILRRHRIKEVILCTSYKPELFRRQLGDGRSLGLKLRYVHEKTPLGTGGAVKNASSFIDETVLILNGDVLNPIDITNFYKAHSLRRAELSISLTRVKDPTHYGVVETSSDGRIRKFVEKPSWDEIESNTINAGAYLFEPSILKHIPPGVNYSLERSLFPQLLAEGARLFGYVRPGYWIDIGTVEKYLQVHLDILGGITPFRPGGKRKGKAFLDSGVRLGRDISLEPGQGRIVVGKGSVVEDFVRLSGNVCIGARCSIGRGSALENCLILDGAHISEGARLERCIIGPGSVIGPQCRLGPGTALAGGSQLKAYSQL